MTGARLFIAVWPHDDELPAIRAAQAAWTWPEGAKLTAPRRMHVTLHFLGVVEPARVDAIRRAIRLPADPFELSFGRAEIWPRGTAVLLPRELPLPLMALHDRLGEALHRIGLAIEPRPYRPHLTLARQAVGAVPPGADPLFRLAVRGHVLAQSERGYRILERY